MTTNNLLRVLILYPLLVVILFFTIESYKGGGDGNLKYTVLLYSILASIISIIFLLLLKKIREFVLLLPISIIYAFMGGLYKFSFSSFRFRFFLINIVSLLIIWLIFRFSISNPSSSSNE